MKKIVFTCDLCQKEVNSEKDICITKISKPNSMQDEDVFDLCPECRKNLLVFMNSMKPKKKD